MAAEQYHRWFSPNLSIDTEMITFGDRGIPVITFPTSKGKYFQNRDFGLIDAVMPYVDAGYIKVFCVDSVDEHSFYDYGIHPSKRMENHMWYDKMVLEEVVLPAIQASGHDRVMTAGASFGGYHAVNFGFRYPHLVSEVISMGGSFDIRQFVAGFYDDTVYFNNPVDFMKNMIDPNLLGHFARMGIILATGENDICREDNYKLSAVLHERGIQHWLDDRPGVGHDWPWWREMIAHYMGLILARREGNTRFGSPADPEFREPQSASAVKSVSKPAVKKPTAKKTRT